MRLLTNSSRDIEQAIRAAKDEPLRLAFYPSAADLPDPADWPRGIVQVGGINAIAFSDGTNWFPLVKGMAL